MNKHIFFSGSYEPKPANAATPSKHKVLKLFYTLSEIVSH
jgi:hypothetical protein